MVRKNWTLREIRREGIEALLDRLGPVATIRFLQQHENGFGDYTQDRSRWPDGLNVQEILHDIEQRRERQ